MRGTWFSNRAGLPLFVLLTFFLLLTGCNGINTPGRMEWVQPHTQAPHVGTVYFIRGWQGVYSAGIDQMAKQVNEQGGTAFVYMPEQYPELAATLVERYKGVENPEPICFVGHSRGVDSSIIISRELAKAGIKVDLIICLDSVDETTVPKNVTLCYNYWMPGVLFGTNLLRGIPLLQEEGSTGQLYNYNLDSKEWIHLKQPLTDHINMDDDPKVQKLIVQRIFETCIERSQWIQKSPVSPK